VSIEKKIQNGVPLAPLTTFKIGGPAKFFVEAETSNDIVEAIRWAAQNNEKYFILGGGSNLLVSDKGYDGLVIKNNCDHIRADNDDIYAEAGAPLAKLVQAASQHALSGLEWAAGIPGTVGGAIRGNAGAFGSSMQSVIGSVDALDPLKFETLKLDFDGCKFSYRHSIFKESGLIVLGAAIRLHHDSQEKIAKKCAEFISYRADSQPKEPSAGSIFKNISVDDLAEKQPAAVDQAEKDGIIRNGKIAAGWLIGREGFKGKNVGGAQISQEHANFIINTGGATAEDVLVLISLVKQKIRVKYGVQLQEEIRFLDN
jgi:UDP-N-acetylmuramate dehydrogenase